MYDTGKILAGLIIFVGIFTFPFWSNAGKVDKGPQPVLPKEGQCVESTAFMKSQHMQLLNNWRTEVVRYHQRIYTAADGKTYLMSLQNTCLKCHTSKAQFCDRCHNYAGTAPYCWSCHIEPPEKG